MGTVFAQVGDPFPTQTYLFVMDAPPKSFVGELSAYAREAQAKTRASEWIQWHLDKIHRESTFDSIDFSESGVDVEGGRSFPIERLDPGAAAPDMAALSMEVSKALRHDSRSE